MTRIACLTVLVGALAGCVQNKYDVELTPVGEKLQRRIHIKRQGPAATPEELQRLATAYSADVPGTPKVQEFENSFAGRLPDDIGGHGTYTRWETPLGSAALYVERFRGVDDIAAEWERRKVAADRVTEHLIGWLGQEFRNDPGWPPLKEFFNSHVRRDLLNLSLYLWTAGLSRQDDQNPEFLVRVVQYLVERGYASYEEVPALLRAASDSRRDDGRHMLEILRQKLVARARDDLFADSLKFLATLESLKHSLDKYLETTAEFQNLLSEWQEKLRDEPTLARPDPFDVLGLYSTDLLTGAVLAGGDQLTLSLNTGREPLATNGDWSAEEQRVSWPDQFLPRPGQPPQLSYAAWEQPNAAVQQSHFGKAVLQGKPLVDYCLWYHGLTEAERTEWDAFVETLSPGEELADKLLAFRFRHELADLTQEECIAARAVDAILAGLKAEP